MGLGDRLGRIVKKEEKRSTPHEVDSGVPRGMEKEKIINIEFNEAKTMLIKIL